jgi:hypothetical protein
MPVRSRTRLTPWIRGRPRGPRAAEIATERQGLKVVPGVGNQLHTPKNMDGRPGADQVLARRRCLVCEAMEDTWERADTDEIGPLCQLCHAPTERVTVLQHRAAPNPHAAALGRLGGLKGGPARAARLSPRRRRDIARGAARARWSRVRGQRQPA